MDKMQAPLERFIGIKADYTIVYLLDCPICDVLITALDQGHRCCGQVEETPYKEWEAVYYAQMIQDLRSIYPMVDWNPHPQGA